MCGIVKLYCTKHEGLVATRSEFCIDSVDGTYCVASITGRKNSKPKATKRNGLCRPCAVERQNDGNEEEDEPQLQRNPNPGPYVKPSTRRRRRSSRPSPSISEYQYMSMPLVVRIMLNLTGTVRSHRSSMR